MAGPGIVVVGIGADGMAGLSGAARLELHGAETIWGAPRQLALLDATVTARLRPWPTPLGPALPGLLGGDPGAPGGSKVHVLASGDPMLHGIGTTLVGIHGTDRVRVLPAVSSVALACARLGWPVHDTEVISVLTAPVHTAVRRGGRAVVLSRDAATPAALAVALTAAGRGESWCTVAEQLGGPAERLRSATAADWAARPPTDVDPLNLVAVHHLPDDRVAGALPDDALTHDGQLTKQAMRAITLAALGPRPGQTLWDVGAGSGSVGIEWCRAAPGCAVVAFECDPDRRARIAQNAAGFGAHVEIRGAAPDGFAGAAAPDAVFLGGGVTTAGLIEACLDRLPTGGRLVANVVTAESEAVLTGWFGRLGGELRRFQHYRGEPVGRYTGWRPAMPVTQWSVAKP